MKFSTQEELDIFLLNGGRVQYINWAKASPTFMFRDLDGKTYYGDDNDRDYRFVKPVSLDYRQVRRFVPLVREPVVKIKWWASLNLGCKWLVVAVIIITALHIVRTVGGF